MSVRTRPPFPADHFGSLLRPAELHAARDDFAAGRIDAAELRRVEDKAIRRIVAKQEETSIAPKPWASIRRRASTRCDSPKRAGVVLIPNRERMPG